MVAAACGPVMFNVSKLYVPVFGNQCSQLMSVLLHMSTLCLCTTISASNPLRTVYTCIMQVAVCKQHPCPSNTRPRRDDKCTRTTSGGCIRGRCGAHVGRSGFGGNAQ